MVIGSNRAPAAGAVYPVQGRIGRARSKRKPDDIVVFWARKDPVCDECGEELGRGALIRVIDGKAIRLAVVASIRHNHTRYDELLMDGWERHDARIEVSEDLDRVLDAWTRGAG